VYVGVKLSNTKVNHVTLAWCGVVTTSKLLAMIGDVNTLLENGPLQFQFDKWTLFEKDEGKKKWHARKCHLVDEKQNEAAKLFYKSYYKPEPGDRPGGPHYHLTLYPSTRGGEMTGEEINALGTETSTSVYIRNAGGGDGDHPDIATWLFKKDTTPN
jgi:hypothetical protein